MIIDLPTEDEVRAVVRAGLSSLGDPPPIVVDQIMRAYFEKWAMLGTQAKADSWLDRHLRAMVTK